jgi:hypothetical protein
MFGRVKLMGDQVEVLDTDIGLYISIDGSLVDNREIAELFNMNVRDISTFMSKNRHRPYHIKKWLCDKLWRIEVGDSNNVKVYQNPNGCRCTVNLVKKMAGLSNSVAAHLLKNWETGDIDTDELFVPKELRKTQYINSLRKPRPRGKRADWGGLSNKPRDHNLARIPDPTPYEKKLGNLTVGRYDWCPTLNQHGHNRY